MSTDAICEELTRVLGDKRGSYQVYFPCGEVQMMRWRDLHVDLKARNYRLYQSVTYRWTDDQIGTARE